MFCSPSWPHRCRPRRPRSKLSDGVRSPARRAQPRPASSSPSCSSSGKGGRAGQMDGASVARITRMTRVPAARGRPASSSDGRDPRRSERYTVVLKAHWPAARSRRWGQDRVTIKRPPPPAPPAPCRPKPKPSSAPRTPTRPATHRETRRDPDRGAAHSESRGPIRRRLTRRSAATTRSSAALLIARQPRRPDRPDRRRPVAAPGRRGSRPCP